jgi:hypothetical protein
MSWNYRSSAANYYYGSSNLSSLTFNASQVSGSLLICALGFCNVVSGGSSGDPTVSDSTNGTWNKGNGTWMDSGWSYLNLFYVINTVNGSPVQVNFSNWPANTGYAMVLIEEFTGNAASSVLDTCSTTSYEAITQGTYTVNGAPLTTTVSGDLIFSAFYDTYPIITAAAGGSLTLGQWELYSGNEDIGDGYQVQSTSGAITPNWTLTSSQSNDGSGCFFLISAAFKPAAGGGPAFQPFNMWPLMGPILAQ